MAEKILRHNAEGDSEGLKEIIFDKEKSQFVSLKRFPLNRLKLFTKNVV